MSDEFVFLLSGAVQKQAPLKKYSENIKSRIFSEQPGSIISRRICLLNDNSTMEGIVKTHLLTSGLLLAKAD